MPDPRYRPFFGIGLGGYFAVLLAVAMVSWAMAANQSQTAITIGNAVPQVTGAAVNSGSPIILSPAGTSSVSVSFTVTDDNGCADVFFRGNVTTTLYRSGVSSTCATSSPSLANQSLLNCYVVATTTHNCPGANSTTTSANATATFSVWYFADATDPSSTYSTHNWLAYVTARDGSSTSVSTSSVSGVELNTLLAIQLASTTLDYGSLNPGENTSSTNQSTTIINAGNSSTTLSVYGTAFVSGTSTMPTSSQHYATDTFTYNVAGPEQFLQSAATAVSGWLTNAVGTSKPTTTTSYFTPLRLAAVAANNGYLYVLGGEDGTARNYVRFGRQNANGTISAWTSTTALPVGLYTGSAVVLNNYIYYFGGLDDGGSPTTTVTYAPITATSAVGAWATTTALPAAEAMTSMVTYNGRVYLLGGFDGGYRNSVYFAYPSSTTGVISNWTSTQSLPVARGSIVGFVSDDGYVYAAGGYVQAVGATSTILRSQITATSALSAWTNVGQLPSPRYATRGVVDEGVVFIAGGTDSGDNPTSSIIFAPLGSGGMLGSWSRNSIALGTALSPGESDTIGHRGFLYTVAGDAGSVQDIVQMMALPSRNLYWGTAANATSTYANYTSSITYVANWTQ